MKTKITAVILLFLCVETSMYSQKNASDLPESYNFTWRYTLEVTDKKQSMKMTYFLAEEQPYYGVEFEDVTGKMKMGEMLMVFDKRIGSTITFMTFGGQKMGQTMKMPNLYDTEDDNDLKDFSFIEIEGKTILGYKCKGIQMENDKLKMTMYFMLNAPVSFNNIFGFDTKSIPKGFNPKWLNQAENSLVMEMEFIDKKKGKNSSTMKCIGLEEKKFSITPSGYTFMKF